MNKEEQLVLYLQEMIASFHGRILSSDLTKPEQIDALKTEVQSYLKRFEVTAEQLVPEIIADEFFGSVDAATVDLVAQEVDVPPVVAIGAGGVIAQEFRDPVYLDALDEIIKDSFLDLRAARRTAEMSAMDTIEGTIERVKGAMAKGTIAGDPRKIMQQAVAEEFRKDGMTSFVTEPDARGKRRRLPLDFYAMTVTRTKAREAGVKAAETRYAEAGQDLVKIYENADTCEICGRFKGMVVSLRGETEGFPVVGENGVRLPPNHPNCRGTISVYVLKRKTPEEVQAAQERNGKYSPTKDNRTPAEKKAYKNEQKKRQQANDEKKQFMRWNETMGADNFQTLGAFRTAKRKNTPKFQELESNYRSARAGGNILK